MKKKALAIVLAMGLILMSGCNTQTRGDASSGTAGTGTSTPAPNSKVDIRLLFQSSSEEFGNIVRDQLSKAGFNVILNMQPDYSSYKAQVDARNYDIDVSGWTTVTGNPDYAVRSLFKTGADYNNGPVADPKIDELIEKAAAETPAEYIKTYGEFEKYLVEEKAYIVPLAVGVKTQATNQKRVVPVSVRLSKSRSMVWETISFVDGINSDTEPLRLSQTISTLTSLDPIKGNDGSINMLNTNMYVRLVNLTDDDKVVSEGSLSYNHAIADGNSEYYFILRDDINFARIKDGHAVDSSVRVGAEDVVFSMERAVNQKSVPNHKTYSLHESMDKVEIVTDMAELESKKLAGSDSNIKISLEAGLEIPISSLVANKTEVKNSDGKYQVVKITTKRPFPQVLNYLAHQSAGIVDSEWVKSINTYDVAAYDVKKDISYGDQSVITEGASYNNTLSCSGPYIAVKKNDYEITFEKNPAYMPTTKHAPIIKNVNVRFFADLDSSLSALRANEIDILYSVPEKNWDIVEAAPDLVLTKMPSNGVTYLTFNIDAAAPYADTTLRRAVLAAINQEELLAVFAGTKNPCYSSLTPLLDTGNKLVFEPGKAQTLIGEYLAAKAK